MGRLIALTEAIIDVDDIFCVTRESDVYVVGFRSTKRYKMIITKDDFEKLKKYIDLSMMTVITRK